MFLDGLLSGFKWYRRSQGGKWVRILHRREGVDSYWTRDRSLNEWEILMDSEVYLEAHTIAQISDGYHDFEELYTHRHLLFIWLMNTASWYVQPWKSKLHEDGTMFEGYFIAGATLPQSGQISYHLPMRYWNLLNAKEYIRAYRWDGHSSKDVAARLFNELTEFKERRLRESKEETQPRQ